MFTHPLGLFLFGTISVVGLVHLIPEVVRGMKSYRRWLFPVFLILGFVINLFSAFFYIFLDIYFLSIPLPDSPIHTVIASACLAIFMAVVPTLLAYCVSVYLLKKRYGLLPMKFSLIVTFLLFLQPIIPAVVHRWF